MQTFDTSSIIYAWDNYPIAQFPGLWDWLKSEITSKSLTIPKIAIEEVHNNAEECGDWLKKSGITVWNVDNHVLRSAQQIKALLGIQNGRYGRGVGENDILIIATAWVYNAELISNEARQPDLPKNLADYKIPAVCNLQNVKVPTVNFIEFIKRSGAVFK